jgi:plastocyanin
MRNQVQPRTSRAIALTGLLIAMFTLVAACGGASKPAADLHAGTGQQLAGMPGASGSAAPSPMSMPMTDPPTAAARIHAQAAPVGGNAVAIKNFAFAPSALTVKVGTMVTWTNQDTDEHTVTSQQTGPLKSSALPTGGHYSYTFTKPGTYSYLCTIHPFMTATVTVTA